MKLTAATRKAWFISGWGIRLGAETLGDGDAESPE
jgi:hypothetical protein